MLAKATGEEETSTPIAAAAGLLLFAVAGREDDAPTFCFLLSTRSAMPVGFGSNGVWLR
jgi:hypothetical protein